MKKIIIAIDGHSACGKSTTAKAVAQILGYFYVDSGAMYRAVTVYFQEHHVAITNPREVARALSNIKVGFKINPQGTTDTYLNGLNAGKKIRKMEVAEMVSQVSAIKEVRAAMVEGQRKLGKKKGIVMDGRDIGSVVFPEAELKLFLTADLMVRAFRRQKELLDGGELVGLDKVIGNLEQRDKQDSTRKVGPLVRAKDAIVIDTTHITVEEQVDEVVRLATGKILSLA
ncbi:MAG: (d)CMP kinase [Cyclobacteriaceae bacterium]|nr:(d)CMP kinase [Cyclobacteriaceae bacterium]MCB0498196.1 (d)CMP kinase [Cyclobacteriaceae bacterium]MCB9238920.1 (d)CMP kinase [Flammeovirgaceae bacterium]MCO5270638.1 (d)CMP kinase [Cyclobacteriaceae bacterium]MCW5900920.1 (d)CMP kinase [Cyclobacteriaceae bacterium]